ncbi:hypothetical protein KQ51_01110 [Candidatus Izimaplasma bacterium HR1]|jgi:hypothetical protein|uniref:hypothetical protein n=1 Tax=Candidatus Izimoplasma sp. HR1 TaxID=1541959 RepID=UPI0004F6D2CC|nr:hypothetical protein KQ51_01110 [Candidatus Izimaplasma bacterium HR1]
MPKRHVYSKDTHGFGDFVYVDLLPTVKRSRQFNMNVIIALLYAIVLAFFLIYRPYSSAMFELEDLNSKNYDYRHELSLTQAEFEGYEIDLSAIQFDQDISELLLLRVDFNGLLDDLEIKSDLYKGTIEAVSYRAETKEFTIEVSFPSQYYYNSLNTEILGLDWVVTSEAEQSGEDANTYIYKIGVDYHVE